MYLKKISYVVSIVALAFSSIMPAYAEAAYEYNDPSNDGGY